MKTLILILMISLPGFSFQLLAHTSSQIPVDAQHSYPKINQFFTPDEYRYGIAWIQAATLHNNHVKNNGYILIDYIKLIEEDTATLVQVTLDSVAFDVDGTLKLHEGGFYNRFPEWYCDSSGNCNLPPTTLTNAYRSGGMLRINVGEEPDSISHAWGNRKYCSLGKRHKVEVSALVSGDIALQIGMDYVSHPEHVPDCVHSEAFFSQWVGDTNDKYVTITYPSNYDFDVKFDRSDYGVTVDGKFFLSKRIVDFLGADTVKVYGAGVPDWIERPMMLNGEYYEYESLIKLNANEYYRYCFNLKQDFDRYVPYMILNKLVYPCDTIRNERNTGTDFFTKPVNTILTATPENLQVSSDLRLSFSADNTHLYVHSQHTIERLYITDMSGRRMNDYYTTIPIQLSFASYNSGVYLVTIETKKGIFSERIIK